MTNDEVRELIAIVALSRLGFSRQQLEYRCEETCAEGVSDVLRNVFNNHNLEGLCTSYSCNTLYADMSDSPYWYEPDDFMIRGDIIFFDWDRIKEDKPLDHVAIVTDVDDDTVTYMNINGSNHNIWTMQTINKYNCNIAYWLRYINPIPQTEPTTSPDQSQTKDDIKQVIEKLQALRDDINVKIDMYIRSLINIK